MQDVEDSLRDVYVDANFYDYITTVPTSSVIITKPGITKDRSWSLSLHGNGSWVSW